MSGNGKGQNLSQEAVLDFLGSASAFDGLAVTRIDTHISHIFLAGERVLKVKRAVKFRFLDFTTLAARKLACAREIEVNQENAPRIYIGTIPITLEAGQLHVDGPGDIVEWAVEMRRFDEAGILSHIVAEHREWPSLMSDVAEKIAESHGRGQVRQDFGGAEVMQHTLADIAATISEEAGAPSEAALSRTIADDAASAMQRLSLRLDARRRHGFVRECHGDLHLENICTIDQEPFLFDAIEFSDEIASIDVIYDLAYPLLDLLFHERGDLANALVNRYLEVTRDYSGLGLLPPFMAMRGMIRAMVHYVSGEGGRYTPIELARAPGYLARASDCLQHASPQLYAVGGLSGSGKSTIAREVAPFLHSGPGAVVLRSDVIRKRLHGKQPEELLPPDAYSAAVTKHVYNVMARDASRALKVGWSVVADATFMRKADRDYMEAIADRLGLPFTGLWLEAPPEILSDRVNGRQHDASDATAEVVDAQLKADIGHMTWHKIDAGGDIQAVSAKSLELLARERPA